MLYNNVFLYIGYLTPLAAGYQRVHPLYDDFIDACKWTLSKNSI